ncbi:hypothetical protein [Parasphingorhabdus sp.]|uniref:hypothetical protein n=1 Tax=Parasphingorhabdus sp. TaxID=2709688 RepID=UPI003A90E97F
MALKLSLVLKAIDQMSAPTKKAAGSVSGLGKVSDNTSGKLSNLTRSVNKSSRAVRLFKVLVKRPSTFVVRGKIDEGRLIKQAERVGKFTGKVIGAGIKIGLAAITAIPVLFAGLVRSVIKTGVELDKGFGTKFKSLTSKLSSQWSGFLLKIGQSGVFDFVIAKLEQLTNWIDKLKTNGKLDEWAKQIGDSMVSMGEWIADIKWDEVGSQLVKIASGLAAVATVLGKVNFGTVIDIAVVAIIGKISLGLYGLATALGVVSIAGAPIWAVVAVIATVAAGAYLLYRNWDKISAWFGGLWKGFSDKVKGGVDAILSHLRGMWEDAKRVFSDGVSAIWNMLPGWMRKVLNGGTFSFRVLGNLFSGQSVSKSVSNAARDSGLTGTKKAAPLARKFAPAANNNSKLLSMRGSKTSVGGKIEVDIRTDLGTTAKVKRVKATNDDVSLAVTLGRSLGFAG